MFNARTILPALIWLVAGVVAQLRLNVTAISAENGSSTLECWEVESPFYISDDPATTGAMVAHLGNVSALSWSVSPPGQYIGLHNAPRNQ